MNIDKLRKQVDAIDEEMLQLLGKRCRIVERIGAIKQQQKLPVRDNACEASMAKKRTLRAAEAGMDQQFVEQLYELITTESRRRQEQQCAKKP
ncbi:chorismate mutase [Candidatus Woesearchaeota archaeon]|nr:chorismate mutase [Candidatus Woesearchaeota archaeon]